MEYNDDGTTEGVRFKQYQPPKIALNNKLYRAEQGFQEIQQESEDDNGKQEA